MIHSVEIAFLFMSFKRLRLEREQIRQILLDLEQLTSDTSFKLENMFLKRAERDSRVARRFEPRARFLYKTKDFFESLKYYLRI